MFYSLHFLLLFQSLVSKESSIESDLRKEQEEEISIETNQENVNNDGATLDGQTETDMPALQTVVNKAQDDVELRHDASKVDDVIVDENKEETFRKRLSSIVKPSPESITPQGQISLGE